MCRAVVKIVRCARCGQLILFAHSEEPEVLCLRCQSRQETIRVRIDCTVIRSYDVVIEIPKHEYEAVESDQNGTDISGMVASWLKASRPEAVEVELFRLEPSQGKVFSPSVSWCWNCDADMKPGQEFCDWCGRQQLPF